MMSKYQEALNRLKERLDPETYENRLEFAEECNALNEASSKAEKYDAKETPMKIQIWSHARPVERCSRCGAGLEREHLYCWNCGQKADWGEKEREC